MKGIVKKIFFLGVVAGAVYFAWNSTHPDYTQRAVAASMIVYANENKAVFETPVDSVKMFSAPKYFVDNGYFFNRVAVLRNESHDVTVTVFLDIKGGAHCLVFPKEGAPDACKKN